CTRRRWGRASVNGLRLRLELLGGVRARHPGIRAPRMRAEDHASYRGDEEDDRRDLKREQVVDEEDAPDPGRRAERGSDLAGMLEVPTRLHPDSDHDLHHQ